MGGLTIKWQGEIKVLRAFGTEDSIELAAPQGSAITAGLAGKVVAVGTNAVRLRADNFIVEYANLTAIKVQPNQTVGENDVLGASLGPAGIFLTVSQVLDPAPLLESVAKPAPQPAPQPAAQPAAQPTPESSSLSFLVPTENGIRVRQAPVSGTPIGQVNTTDVLELLEDAAGAQAKLGKSDQWIKVRTDSGKEGFINAAYVKAHTGAAPQPSPNQPPASSPTPAPAPTRPARYVAGARNFTGMNLDQYNPVGAPDPAQLEGIGWIRVKFNMSLNPDITNPSDPRRYGNKDVNATFNRVTPFIKRYVDAGMKVLMVFTHQLYGEGAGFNWETIDDGGWDRLIPTYADYARQVAEKYRGTGLVHAYQIWNEQDTLRQHMRAAVPLDPRNYAKMLTQTVRVLRPVAGDAQIITGGHVTGNWNYAVDTFKQIPADARPDGIAFHPYGLGPGQRVSKWSNNGLLVDSIRGYGGIMPDKPVWITEWGVLNVQGQDHHAQSIGDYVTQFLNICKQFPDKIACACWYAWGDGMDNGYGLVRGDGSPRDPVFSTYKRA